MRLIDADKVIVPDDDCLGECRNCKSNITNCSELADLINDAPTVDAVEVVRCKDCKYHDTANTEKGRGYCWWFDSCVDDDDYCSYGERGEQDENR